MDYEASTAKKVKVRCRCGHEDYVQSPGVADPAGLLLEVEKSGIPFWSYADCLDCAKASVART